MFPIRKQQVSEQLNFLHSFSIVLLSIAVFAMSIWLFVYSNQFADPVIRWTYALSIALIGVLSIFHSTIKDCFAMVIAFILFTGVIFEIFYAIPKYLNPFQIAVLDSFTLGCFFSVCALAVILIPTFVYSRILRKIFHPSKQNKRSLWLAYLFFATTLLLIIFPPWSICEEIPSGATTNDIYSLYGQSFIFCRPAAIQFCGTSLNYGLSPFFFLIEAFTIGIVFVILMNIIENWVSLRLMAKLQKGILATSLLLILGVSTLIPWKSSDIEVVRCTKYSIYQEIKLAPFWSPPSVNNFDENCEAVAIDYFLLSFPLLSIFVLTGISLAMGNAIQIRSSKN